MRKPGWYPDPRGGFLLRYFDGSQWSDRVRALPDAAERVDATYRPHRWGGDRAFWITSAVLTGLILPIVAFFLVPKPPKLPPVPLPTPSASSTTTAPTNACAALSYVPQTPGKPSDNKHLYASTIKIPSPASPWKSGGSLWFEISDAQSVSRMSDSGQTDVLRVGSVSAVDDGTIKPEDATQFLLDCRLDFILDKTGYRELASEEFEAGGLKGWRRRVHVDITPETGSKGTTLEIIVVDTPSEQAHDVVAWQVDDADAAGASTLGTLAAQVTTWR